MAAPEAEVESEWSAHVWKWVKEEFDTLVKLPALSKAEGGVGVICDFDKESQMKEFTKNMEEYKEFRGVVSNVCCTPPEATSIPGDEIVMDMLGDMARFRFYKDGKPCAPTVWPKDSNISVALFAEAAPPMSAIVLYPAHLAAQGNPVRGAVLNCPGKRLQRPPKWNTARSLAAPDALLKQSPSRAERAAPNGKQPRFQPCFTHAVFTLAQSAPHYGRAIRLIRRP